MVGDAARADHRLERFISWVLGVGSICAGGLLLWIGSTTFQLAKDSAVNATILQQIQAQQSAAIAANSETARSVRDLSIRVQRLEDSIHRERAAREDR